MPANKNAVIRYKFLDVFLSDRHHQYSMDEITEKMNERLEDLGYTPIVKRTLEKDLAFLKERPFCAPIEKYKSGGKICVRYAKSTYSIFHYELSKEEKTILHELINALGQFNGIPDFKWLEAVHTCLGLERRKLVLSFSQLSCLGENRLMTGLYESILNKKVLNVKFKGDAPECAEGHVIHPYLLKEYNGRWFLFGYYKSKGQMTTVPIDCIESFEHLKDEVYEGYQGDVDDFFNPRIEPESFNDRKPEEIVFWAGDAITNHIKSQSVCRGMQVDAGQEAELRKKYVIPEGGGIFRFYSIQNEELMREFVRHFDALLIIKPEKLSSQMRERVLQLKEMYDNLHNADNG